MYDEEDIEAFIEWMYKLDALFIKKVGRSVHLFVDMPFKQWFDCDMSVEEVVAEFLAATSTVSQR
jgi:hypothetical protein